MLDICKTNEKQIRKHRCATNGVNLWYELVNVSTPAKYMIANTGLPLYKLIVLNSIEETYTYIYIFYDYLTLKRHRLLKSILLLPILLSW